MRLHLLVPDGIADPRRPSGGNTYDRRLAAGLGAAGWQVAEHHVGRVPLADALAGLPDGALVLVDGLVASTTPALVAESGRLRTAVLLHMPGSGPCEPEVLRAVHAVVVPSRWARDRVTDLGVPAGRVHVAAPGVDHGPVVAGSPGGTRLLCVGPVTPAKGYDVLLAALADLVDLAHLPWRCRWVGALDLDPGFVADLRAEAARLGIADRVELTGPVAATGLDTLRADTDLVVAPSRRESWGMALAEGLARGLPAVATDVGGHPEALGSVGSVDDEPPGALVPAGDAAALAAELRSWLTDPALRDRWRSAAARRRSALGSWAGTVEQVAAALDPVARGVVPTGRG
ncbi:Glycosyltransferase [Nocardioides sp. J9]|uniref:glycosyltransferase family 4 protein n=1 Tax=Nocardioides sp. J9 TaxID=935844 RepID=UPI0011ACF715|nr:glycosyltransferase family 4 protein [Nocardioides sp. J9]TWG99822.1 Glycosyltransferase [Nocardioides sp. J9]